MSTNKLYKLTNPQKNIWDTEIYFSNSCLNNIGGYVFIEENVNMQQLEQAINIYVKKNEALRLQIVEKESTPYQYVTAHKQFKIEIENQKNETEVKKRSEQFVHEPFEILNSKLYKFKLFKLPNGQGGFYVVLHHLISDAWNMSLLINEIIEIYSKLMQNQTIDNTDYPSYTEYINTQNEYLTSNRIKKDEEFWKKQFESEPEISYISTKNKQELCTKSKRKEFLLSPELYKKIENYTKENKTSIYTFFMAIYSLYIADINNTTEQILGTPVLNRRGIKEKHTAGMFISTVPFKNSISKNNTFNQYIKEVTTKQLSIFRHQKYPYNKLLQEIKNKYNLSENLYDLVVSYQNARDNKTNSNIAYHSHWVENDHILDSLEVHFYDMDDTGNLTIFYDYQVNKFTEKEIENLHARILNMAETVLKDPNIELNKIEIINKKEKKLLKIFNETSYEYDKNKTILQIFEENVEKNKDKTALIFENKTYTYEQLNQKANQIANYLKTLKLKKNNVIGIMLNRSDDTIILMLAILKANLAYMLIEQNLPEDRIKFMLRNVDSPLFITSTNVPYVAYSKKEYIENIKIEKYSTKAPKIEEEPQDYMSVVYTSGSTGMPKGVIVKRQSIINLVNGYKETMQIDKLNNFLSICSVAFDMFAAEVWIALLSAKKLILANEEEAKNPVEMSKLINKEKCEFMLITASKLDLLLSNSNTSTCMKYVKAIQLGGEVLNPNFYSKLVNCTKAEIYNGYGPSETTSCCTCKHITSAVDITIGKPLPNVQIYICNKDLKICPIGVTGEICIAGDGVTYGYANNNSTTNKHFIKNPFGEGMLYKSGDLAKWNYNGEIEYIGRNDFQIKIRGLRVELEEINNAILSIENIEKSVTIVRKINEIESICSFIIAPKVETSKVKEELITMLPHYMIPTYIIKMDTLPLSINGKIDRKKLPEIEVKTEYIAPKTKTQKYVAKIFEKFLNIEKVSINSDFFELGGDSLIAIKILTQINCDLNIKLSIKEIFENATISILSKHIEALTKESKKIESRKKAEINETYLATSAQKRIFYSIQSNKKTMTYNTPGGFLFNRTPIISKLEKCFTQLIKEHEALRTYFIIEDGEVKQKIIEPYQFKLETVEGEYTQLDNIFSEFLQPFDLTKAPLFRAKLIKFEKGNSALLIDFHHIICDGTSISIFIKELCSLYNGKNIEENEFDYKDFALWEQDYFKSDKFEEDKKYWVNQYKEEVPTLAMPTTYTRPSIISDEGTKITYEILNAKRIIKLCNKLKTTPYMFLLAVYYILLYKYTNQTEIVVGTPLSGRNITEVSNMIGMFVNTLALKNNIEKEQTFKSFLDKITEYCLEAFEHNAYPFDKLVEDIGIKRDTSRTPIFDTMFVYQNEDMPKIDLNKITTKYYTPDNKTSKFDFLIEIIPKENSFKVNLEYRTKLFSKKFMANFLNHYSKIIKQVTKEQEIKIADICMLSREEEKTILNLYEKNKLTYPKEKVIIQLFEEQALKEPKQIAIIYKNEKITYEELKNKVDAFSYYLYKRGVKKGDIVGTLLNRSTNLIVAMLSIMKCGAVYLPISKQFPKERISYIIKNSKLSLLIIDNEYQGETYDKDIVNIDIINKDVMLNVRPSAMQIEYQPEDAIYSIYTSGSTGSPKGVLVTNRNLNNFVHSFNKLFDNSVGKKDISISTTSICFDVSIWEFFFSLLNGVSLYLYEADTIEDIFDFCKVLTKEHITMAYLPPNILNEVYTILAKTPKEVYLEKLLLGVEPIKTSVIKKFYNLNTEMKIVNGYGPTETTICSTAFVVTKSNCTKYTTIPIGKPLNNVKAYVLDENLSPVPIGVSGELYIAGDNITKGYLNNKNLTNEKYIPCPFEKEGVMYATGDVVKILPDYNIGFIGRNDGQIKIKGHRIEINEIISSISTYPSITKSAVLVKKQKGNNMLAAYFTADKKIILNDLRSFLSFKLPFYAIPNFFVQLEKFPLTINGKIDTKQLTKIELKENNLYESPRNKFEKQLVKLWQEFLNIEKVGINDNFFDLGGDSLIAIRMQVEAFSLGLNISYADIFSYPTIKQLSQKIAVTIPETKMENYNYSKINKLLEKNNGSIPNSFKKIKLENILLTGVTGFVGAHILDKLLTQTTATVYCLVRSKNNMSSINRIYKTLEFYFGNKYDKLIGNKIQIIEGDITNKQFGLDDEEYQRLGKKLSCIINSAAIVKHYGKAEVFDKTNIEGVENIINVCKEFGITLYHLSTLSVSGNVFAEDGFKGATTTQKSVFKESNLFINQDISNIYVYTKFMAERLILENIEQNKLKAVIIRLGNITNRYSDGKFQINISENAFLNRLLTFIKLGCIPDYILEGYGEFTPVDYVADAICKIVQVKLPYTVLHLYNNNHVPMDKLISILRDYGINMQILPEKEFLEVVDVSLKKERNILSGIINDFDTNKKLVYDSNIILNNNFTNEVLSKISFRWCNIGKAYLFKYLDYLKELGYLGGLI